MGKTVVANGFYLVPKFLDPRIRTSVLLERQHGARQLEGWGQGSPAALWVSRSWGRACVLGSLLHLCGSAFWDSQKAACSMKGCWLFLLFFFLGDTFHSDTVVLRLVLALTIEYFNKFKT